MTTIGEARAAYYERNQFGADGGHALRWVPIKMFGVTVVKIPNTDGRRRAVRIHDVHHLVTGYQTDFRGESEIAAWELASGCASFPAALVLNAGAMTIGLWIAPVRVVRGWARGRATANLYVPAQREGVDHLLGRTVAELRAELGLDAPAPGARLRDVLAVAGVGLALAVLAAAPIALIVALLR